MRKVAVLTIQRSLNYGAVLQAYALQKSINSFGVHCEILDLLRPVHPGYRFSPNSEQLAAYRPKRDDASDDSLLPRLKTGLRRRLDNIVQRKRIQRFQRFDQEYMTYSSKPISCAEELYKVSAEYDAYVTGSDQVWNPTYPYSPEPYFLTFVPQGIPRIAYAPSFGVSTLDPRVHDKYRQWLQGITRLSVREKQGASLINELTGRTAEVVLDPTLLLTHADWLEISKKPPVKKPYIFCYDLGNNISLQKLCRYLCDFTGYDVYRISNHMAFSGPGIIDVYGAGPQEFLGWVKNAALVVTNSFHGLLFSVNMQKPFFVVINDCSVKSGVSRNSRHENILELFNMRDRLWHSGCDYPDVKKMELFFDDAMRILTVERSKSFDYLKSSIYSHL